MNQNSAEFSLKLPKTVIPAYGCVKELGENQVHFSL